MKFEPLFKSEKNRLVKLDGTLYSTKNLKILELDALDLSVVEAGKIFAVKVPLSKIDLGGQNYNEELLASLRDFLKNAEERGAFAFMLPAAEKEIADSDAADEYIKAMVHLARRIKDCQGVVGFAVPNELLQKDAALDQNSYTLWFVNEMSVKHSHYLYFLDGTIIQQMKLDAEVSNSDFVLY